jgi:hypothetical protein
MKTLLMTAMLTALVVTGVTSPARAQAKKQEMVIVYYDNEEHRNVVGQVVFFCDGTRFRRGAFSLYFEEIDYSCD